MPSQPGSFLLSVVCLSVILREPSLRRRPGIISHPHQGRHGHSWRTTVAIAIVAQLRQLSDRKVIEAVKENRYLQYSAMSLIKGS
jgi:hypothetical protein